jgi:hypothetical protein
MHRRRFIASSIGLLIAFSSHAQADDAEIASMLVGVWKAKQHVNGMELDNLLTLSGDGGFAFTSSAYGGVYQSFQRGIWFYAGGWIQFNTTYSQPRDPNNEYLIMAPLQVLEVTDRHLRTQLGTATRVG